jgi:hypothetical protein
MTMTAYTYSERVADVPNKINPGIHQVAMEPMSPALLAVYSQKFSRALRIDASGTRNATVESWYTAPMTNASREPSVRRCVSATTDGRNAPA